MNTHNEKAAAFERYCLCSLTISGAVKAGNITDRQWANATEKFASGAVRETAIGFLDTTLAGSGKNGYLFTDEKVYYLATLESPQKLWYDEIEDVFVTGWEKRKDADRTLHFRMKDGTAVEWKSPLLRKTPLCEFFREILRLEHAPAGNAQAAAAQQKKAPGVEAAGLSTGAYGTVNKLYDEERFHASQGHGFAAERANDLVDRITGHDARIVGDDNAKNGADRIVDGICIQSKYCATGTRCINECFEAEGKGTFRYMQGGKPMQIEVPADQEIYDTAVKTMARKIENGQVPGVTDPNEATNLVRRGHFTYRQARNIAKAGTVESITYDAVNGAVIATSAFGVTAMLTFATSVWDGEDFQISLKNATYSGLKVGGTAFITSVLSSQLLKAGLNSAMVGGSEAVVRLMGSKASAVLINAFRAGAKPIYGAAAMKSAAKLLRGNAVTAGVTVVVLSSADVVDIFRGRISAKQLMKNLAGTAGTVAGGTGGWMAGAAAGSLVVPGAGTAVGGVLGSLSGGAILGGIAGKAADAVAEDDAEEMVRILQKVFQDVSDEYLLNHKEAEKCADRLSEKLDGKVLKEMFASSDREAFARTIILPIVEHRAAQREIVPLPDDTEMTGALQTVLEEIADAEAAGPAT